MEHMRSDAFMNRDFPFWIQRNTHQDQAVRPHSHDFIELVFVSSGQAEHHFEQTSYPVQAGDCFIINPGEVHGYLVKPNERLEIINCLFMPNLIHDSLLRELNMSESMDYFYVHPFLNIEERFHHRLNVMGNEGAECLYLLESMIRENSKRQAGFPVIIRLRMLELLILLSRSYRLQQKEETGGRESRGRSHEWLVRRICGYLERHFDQKITLTSLSQLFNVSVRQLNRLFKNEINRSVIETLHMIRIEKAKYLLLETDEKIISIAGAVGYDDPAFFSQLFVRRVGTSPGRFRDQVEYGSSSQHIGQHNSDDSGAIANMFGGNRNEGAFME